MAKQPKPVRFCHLFSVLVLLLIPALIIVSLPVFVSPDSMPHRASFVLGHRSQHFGGDGAVVSSISRYEFSLQLFVFSLDLPDPR